MTAFIHSILLLLATLPLTTVLKNNGIEINVLPFQVLLILVLFVFYFKLNEKSILSRFSTEALITTLVVFLTINHSQTDPASLFKNTLIVFLFLLLIFTRLWPPREFIVLHLRKALVGFCCLFAIISAWLLLTHVQTKRLGCTF